MPPPYGASIIKYAHPWIISYIFLKLCVCILVKLVSDHTVNPFWFWWKYYYTYFFYFICWLFSINNVYHFLGVADLCSLNSASVHSKQTRPSVTKAKSLGCSSIGGRSLISISKNDLSRLETSNLKWGLTRVKRVLPLARLSIYLKFQGYTDKTVICKGVTVSNDQFLSPSPNDPWWPHILIHVYKC